MIWVVWNVWNEIGHLPRSVQDASDVAEEMGVGMRHVFVDGRYPTFPGDTLFSSDGTLEYAVGRGDTFAYAANEVAKRSIGLRHVDDHARPGDWVLVLDADERLVEMELPAAKVGIIRFIRQSDGYEYPRARLYRWEWGLHFRDRHLDLYDADCRPVAWLTGGVDAIECGTGVHADDTCSPGREIAKQRYYRWLQDHEANVGSGGRA